MNWVAAGHHFNFVILVQSAFPRLNGEESSDNVWLMMVNYAHY